LINGAQVKKIDDPVKDALDKGALRVANDTKYGLSAGLFSNDITKALYPAEGLGAGTVHVNSGSIDADAVFPFWGCNSSGRRREGGRYSIEAMTHVKWITIQKSQKRYPSSVLEIRHDMTKG